MQEKLTTFINSVFSLLEKESADEVVINGSRGTFVSGSAGFKAVPTITYDSENVSELACFLAWKQGLRLDAMSPSCGGMIENPSLRWHAVVSPVAQDGIVLSLRRHRFQELSLDAFRMTSETRFRLDDLMKHKRSLLIVGATGSGKTTLLVSLLRAYHFERRVVIMESLAELPSVSSSWIRLTESAIKVTGGGAFSLLEVSREVMRLRPEVMVVGELRGGEAEVYLDMSLTGHGGCFATIHGGSTEAAMLRLKVMAPQMSKAMPSTWSLAVLYMEKNKDGFCVVEIEDRAF